MELALAAAILVLHEAGLDLGSWNSLPPYRSNPWIAVHILDNGP